MNAKQLIAAVIALTAMGTAFADQNANRPYAGKTRADAVSVRQIAHMTHAGSYQSATTPNTALTHN